MSSDNHEGEAQRTVELPAEQMDLVYELALRGLGTIHPADREHHQAFDAFVEEAGYPLRIGDQPENVQERWSEIVGGNDAD